MNVYQRLFFSGVNQIEYEKSRQVKIKKYTLQNDNKYKFQELARAGATYATPENLRVCQFGSPVDWVFGKEFWKPSPNDRIKELRKAGALIASAIDVEIQKERKRITDEICKVTDAEEIEVNFMQTKIMYRTAFKVNDPWSEWISWDLSK